MIDIEGLWHSRYKYPQGPNNEPQVSEHQIAFTKTGDNWIGRSQQQLDGSDVTLDLIEDEAAFSGSWQEQTAPNGDYNGREFRGLLMLAANDAVQPTELNGFWMGTSSSTKAVKVGSWALRRVTKMQ